MAISIYQLTVDVIDQLTIAQPLCHAQPMVDKNDLRAAFSSRLHEALDDADVRRRGRGVDIHKQLKSVGVEKTTQAISKWLNGEAMAEADSMVALCRWLNVRREWMEYGVPPKALDGDELKFSTMKTQKVNTVLPCKKTGKVPLITWVQAGKWREIITNSKSLSIDTWLSCPVSISNTGYALLVRGDSMSNPGPGRSYPNGCIIFVDPEITPKTGDRVIATVPTAEEATFKILVEDVGRHYLRSINPQYPIIAITEGTCICGKVVGSFIPE